MELFYDWSLRIWKLLATPICSHLRKVFKALIFRSLESNPALLMLRSKMYLLIVFLPLFSSFLSGCFGRKIGTKGAALSSSLCMIITFSLSFWGFYESIIETSTTFIKGGRWIDYNWFINIWGLQFDPLVTNMLFIVTAVSAIVHIYSTNYLDQDPHLPRFMCYLSLFTFFMIFLVSSDNFLQLFIGWEGVGLCSYLLINFWFTRIQANKAAIKAMLVNKVGDIGLILAIFNIWYELGSLDFHSIYLYTTFNQFYDGSTVNIICLLLFLGVVGKSAQLGLHTWLPDAMEGPTPVSALIHAATMVTAGVFLIIRACLLFESSQLSLIIIITLGSLTAFFSATIGMVQNDIKKIIAYSTCSQLGYMGVICGASNYSVGLYHLVNHAFFKALLFLGAGSIIHVLSNEQDIRKMGGLINNLPLTYFLLSTGSLSLMGLPFLTGFYSKDLILELVYEKSFINFFYCLILFTTFLTAFYSMRLLYIVFIDNVKFFNFKTKLIKEGPNLFIYPLISLFFGSVWGGYLSKNYILGPFLLPFSPFLIKIAPLLSTFVGGLSFLNLQGRLTPFKWKFIINIYFFIVLAWHFNTLVNFFLVKPVFDFNNLILYRLLDRGFLETLGPAGIVKFFIYLSSLISFFQSGLIFNYSLIIILFISCFFFLT